MYNLLSNLKYWISYDTDTHYIELLSQHGVLLPGNMQGLTEEQISELKLRDEFEEVCVPSGGYIMNPDPMGRRNGI